MKPWPVSIGKRLPSTLRSCDVSATIWRARSKSWKPNGMDGLHMAKALRWPRSAAFLMPRQRAGARHLPPSGYRVWR